MPIDSKLVGANERQIILWGDPASAAAYASALTAIDARNLAGLYTGLVQSVGLVLNPAGTYDLARAAAGTTGVPVVNTEGTKPTFSAGTIGFTPVATPTDFWTIIGSASKTVRVLRVTVTGIATAAASIGIQLIKRSSANTGGTTSTLTIAPHDSNDAAATAVVSTYSVNPTGLGTSIGLVRAKTLNLGAAGAAGEIVFDFGTRNSRAVVLRGVAQALALNWNGAAVPAGTVLTIDVEFSEES